MWKWLNSSRQKSIGAYSLYEICYVPVPFPPDGQTVILGFCLFLNFLQKGKSANRQIKLYFIKLNPQMQNTKTRYIDYYIKQSINSLQPFSLPCLSMMLSKHLIRHSPLLLLPSVFPSTWGFSNESVLCIN